MADWYVYQHDGDPLGPWSTDVVADAILSGRLAPDVWVAAPGGPRWLRALDVPVIGILVEGMPTKPRRDSGLRLIPRALTGAGAASPPVFGSRNLVKDDAYALEEPATRRTGGGAVADDTMEMAARPPVSARFEARAEDDARLTTVALDVVVDGEEPSTDPQPPPSSPRLPPEVSPPAPAADRRERRGA